MITKKIEILDDNESINLAAQIPTVFSTGASMQGIVFLTGEAYYKARCAGHDALLLYF